MKTGTAFEILCVSFLLGIALSSFVVVPFFVIVLFSSVGFVLITTAFFQKKSGRVGLLFFIGIFFLGFSVGVLRYRQSDHLVREVLSFTGKKVSISGFISDEPDVRQDNTHLFVTTEQVEGENLKEKVLVIAERYPEFQYGEKVEMSGVIQKPGSFDTGGGRIFDYESYLAQNDTVALLLRPDIKKIGDAHLSLVGALLSVKQKFIQGLTRTVPEPYASFLAGLIVGAKHSLSREWLTRFRDVGLIHVVVLSGYNITIVAEFIQKILSYLKIFSRRFLFSASAFAIILFGIMAGGTATVIRAVIMALIVILAKATGRTYGVKRALLIAATVMVVVTPKSLIFDTSFQLSFLATLALIYVSPLIEPYVSFLAKFPKVREIAVSTISTQITVLPLILYKIGVFSLIALFSNILILPFIPVTMLVGFITGFIAMFSPLFASPFAFVTYLFTFSELSVVKLFSHFPFSAFSVPAFPWWMMILAYAVFFVIYMRLQKATAKN